MRIARFSALVVALMTLATACKRHEAQTPATDAQAQTDAKALSFAADLPKRLAQMPKTAIDYDRTLLDDTQTQVVHKLVLASRLVGEIFSRQVSEGNPAMREELVGEIAAQRPLAPEALAYFDVMAGPWDRLENNAPFIGTTPKPLGAAYYPADLTKEEFEAWLKAHPEDSDAFRGLFTVIRRGDKGGLVAKPYSTYYADLLTKAAAHLREAAALTKNASLKKYLSTRADAFFSDDYFASDVAWMDLDSDIEVVIGPYEVYEDRLFNYKAAFESFVTVSDKAESQKLAVYASHLPAMEKNLPLEDKYKNPNRGTDSPIKVVQEIYTAGDTRSGVQTSAFNLPNDERVREAKGSKKVLLKNVMQAKFRLSGEPIAERVLDLAQKDALSFDAYFNIVLFHELSHGLGPGIITGPDGKKVEARLLLANLYSMIEECKADVIGVWNVLYALDNKLLTSFDPNRLFVTYAGLMFRSMRFGVHEAHGGGNAIQWNWYREKGVITPTADGRYHVDVAKFKTELEALGRELLTIEATGDFARAQKLIEHYAKETPEIDRVIGSLEGIPVDIDPVYVGAGESMP